MHGGLIPLARWAFRFVKNRGNAEGTSNLMRAYHLTRKPGPIPATCLIAEMTPQARLHDCYKLVTPHRPILCDNRDVK